MAIDEFTEHYHHERKSDGEDIPSARRFETSDRWNVFRRSVDHFTVTMCP